MLGGTMGYGRSAGSCCPRHCDAKGPTERASRVAAMIPVYPEEITMEELSRLSGLASHDIVAVLYSISNHYLLCEDNGRYSLLRRGCFHVD